MSDRAPAKINLTLHVLGRRADGYHELDSLVAFAGVHDRLTLQPGPRLSLTTAGATAESAGPPDRNLVMLAARALAERRPGLRVGAFHLHKRLPAAAGIGGGSSDAAAALRLLAELNGIAVDDPAVVAAARATGADVPVCLAPRARFMRGAGEDVGPALNLPPLFAVLVNPGAAVPTAGVFRALGLEPGQMLSPRYGDESSGFDVASLQGARNDLEAPAIGLAPAIGDVLRRLRAAAGCRLARMSGSGATCFALYDDCHAAARAAREVRATEPGWWVRPTLLR